MSKIVNVDIDNETGNVSIDIIGGVDSSCSDISDAFKKLGRCTKDIKKPEYYQKPNASKVTTGR